MEKDARRRVERALVRGRQVEDPEEARLVVQLARERIAELNRERRRALIGALLFVPLVAGTVLAKDTFFAVVFAVVGVLWLLAALALAPVLRPRYEKAIELNENRE